MERPIKVMAASFRELSVRRGWGVVEPQEVVNPQAARSRSGHTQSTVLSGASLRVKSHSLDPGQSLKTPGLLSTSPSLSYAEDWNSETKRVSKFFHGLYVPSALCGAVTYAVAGGSGLSWDLHLGGPCTCLTLGSICMCLEQSDVLQNHETPLVPTLSLLPVR